MAEICDYCDQEIRGRLKYAHCCQMCLCEDCTNNHGCSKSSEEGESDEHFYCISTFPIITGI